MDNEREPSAFTDMAEVEKTLSDDTTGDRARSMIGYFDELASSSQGLLEQPLEAGERQLVAQLIDGFAAAQRVVRDVWEAMHSASLPA